jgi:glutamate formiminotransferase
VTVLAVPNWSLVPDNLVSVANALRGSGLTVHYCEGDTDHRRTVTAFSGPWKDVVRGVEHLCETWFPLIDLSAEASGVHPKVGALDVCPFVLLEGDEAELIGSVAKFGAHFSERFEIPVRFYERSGDGTALPDLRRGGVDAQQDRHPKWGVTVMGVRDFLLAINVNFSALTLTKAREIAAKIRDGRDAGEPKFTGVRALGLSLASRGQTQVSMNFTQPDLTSVDHVVEYIEQQAGSRGVTELIGVIRERDLATSTRLQVRAEQVVYV